MLQFIKTVLLYTTTILIIWINLELHQSHSRFPERTDEIVAQLNFLEDELKHQKLGVRMQSIFPEGYVFINALYGLTWCELNNSLKDEEHPYREKSILEAKYAYDQIDSDLGRIVFNPDLLPAYGAFYNGWKNYLLGKLLFIDDSEILGYAYHQEFILTCEAISEALKRTENSYLYSYQNNAWPADMFLAMASLHLHDQIYTPKYQSQIKEWLVQVKQNIDPKTGLIPHKIDPSTNQIIEGARGCSISLILRILSEIDPVFAQQQFELYYKHFVSSALGFTCHSRIPKRAIRLGRYRFGTCYFRS